MDSLKASLLDVVCQNPVVVEALTKVAQLNLPNWYIGAGCIAQSVWNHYHGYQLDSFIGDIDLVYYDSQDTSFEAENAVIEQAASYFEDFPIPLDIKNQARVHLWYPEKFGYPIAPYMSTEHAITTWPTTATAIAITLEGPHYHIYAPFGLSDLFALKIKANKVQITQTIYEAKCQKWEKHWPKLKFEPWDSP